MISRSSTSDPVTTDLAVRPTITTLPDEFDSPLGDLIIRWMKANLTFGPGDREGEPYDPDPYLARFIRGLYRVDDAGARIVRRAVLGVAKGNAKSEAEASIALTELDGPAVVDLETGRATRRTAPDIPVAAASYEQADLVFGAARSMATPLAHRLDIYDTEILRKETSGRMYRVAAVAATNDGLRPTMGSFDELHEWTGRKERVYTVLTNGLTKRAGSFELSVSTAGDPVSSTLLLNLYEYGKRVASGEIDDPTFLMEWYEAPEDLDLNDPQELRDGIRQANPASWIDVDVIARKHEVDRMRESDFRRYFLNQWVSSSETWLPSGVWEDLADPQVVEDGTTVVLGFDGSYAHDATALIGATVEEVPHVFTVSAWERPPNAPEGWRVPTEEVDAAVDRSFRTWNVAELVCDPARWSRYVDLWSERYGDDRVVEYPNTRSRMAPATAKFYDAALTGQMTQDGSLVLARHIANATVKEIPHGRYVLQKDSADRKIDAAIAAVMAFDRATYRREKEQEFRVELW